MRSYRTISPLPLRAVCFCGTFRRVAPPRLAPGAVPCEVRTFLPGMPGPPSGRLQRLFWHAVRSALGTSDGAENFHERLVRTEDLLGDRIDQREHFEKALHPLTRDPGFLARIVGGKHGYAIADRADGRVDLPALAFAHDPSEHLPDIPLADINVLAIPRAPEAADDAPIHQVTEVHARVAATDVQPLDNLVHAPRPPGHQEKRVNLSHRPVDAPTRAHPTPLEDELVLSGGQGVLRQLGLAIRHGFEYGETVSYEVSVSDVLIRPAELAAPRASTVRGTFFVQTWGCQMNEEDSEQMGLYLRQIGFEPAASLREAQVVLLNTCSVRKKPEDKAFSLLGELAPIKRGRADMVLGVCGCMAQLRADEIRRRAPHVDFVVGTAEIAQIPGLVEEALQRRRFAKRLHLPERKGAVVTDLPERHVARKPKLKAFVPIQYGCDKFCSFCIVPTTRGRERSRPTADIVQEVAKLAAQGTREVTLLGQTVNSYGKNLAEGRVPFSKLLWLLSEIEGLERIRYTSPYPRDFRADLIEAIRDCPKVMEHVHLPLQSGDDDMLRAMKRQYTREGFLGIVDELRRAIPGVGITTDIIVGFPGETEEQFEATLDVVESVRFDGAFMFIYSPRPGTPAASLPQLPYDLKNARLRRLADLQNRISLEINESFVGKELEVLVEGPSPKNPALLQGFSREFKMVHFPGDPSLVGRLLRIQATEPRLWGLLGRLVDQAKVFALRPNER